VRFVVLAWQWAFFWKKRFRNFSRVFLDVSAV
jgi:hypothetical protein